LYWQVNDMTDMISQLVPRTGREAMSGLTTVRDNPEVAAARDGQNDKVTAADDTVETLSAEKLAAAVNRLNEHIQITQRSLRFSVDEASGRTVVTVVDTQSDEVIRQIPSEEVLALIQHLRNDDGLLINEQA
jgi:flagellar protein FlaG